jgi:hypothetical protein
MQVTLKKSAFGGVQAVLSIPTALLVEMPEGSRPSVLAPEPVRAPVPTAATVIRSEPAAAFRPEPVAPSVRPEPAETRRPEPATGPRQRHDQTEDLAPLPQRRRQPTRAASGSRPTGGPGGPGGSDDSGGRLLTTPEEAQKRWGDFQVGAEAGRREALPSQQHDITEGI